MFASYQPQSAPRTGNVGSRRTVFSNAMVAHVWAQQDRRAGRSSNGNFYFEGATIFSYGTHFPIARFLDAEFDGKRVVLFNGEKRSVSTSQHQSYVLDALRGLDVHIFHVPNIGWHGEPPHAANVRHLVEAFNAYAARLAKAHVKNWQTDRAAEWNDLDPAGVEAARVQAVLAQQSRVIEYCNTFGVECPNLDTGAKCIAIRAAFSRYYDAKAVAKRAAAAAKRGARHWTIASQVAAFFEGVTDAKPNVHFVGYAAKRAIANALGRSSYNLQWDIDREWQARQPRKERRTITVAQWLDGAGTAADLMGQHYGATLVRRKGDKLETSRGVDCPFSHAVVAFLKAQHCRSTCTPWQRNGQQIRVGVFNVDRIDEAGNLVAGCHTIAWEEMLRLAVREVPHMVKPIFPLPALAVS